MYVGHFAIGLAIRARYPKVPALPIMMGVGFLDLLDGIFILLGFNTVTPNLASGPYLFFDLTFIDWDHSLLAALFWSVIWGLLFIKHRAVAAVAALAAFSHFIADWPMHNSDLALYPYSIEHYGYGLWGKLGTLAWVLEGAFSAVLAVYAWRISARRGVSLVWPCAVLVVLFLQLSPVASPMKFVATLQEPLTHILHGALVSLGFLIPGLLLTWLLDRAERVSS
ncbi:hypothetical protein [Pseudomonas coleopterorum]|uniref:LexA-binding, inner membrane-associated hydrolase n=1 Tax=Pseudomonas coleopterorum TaxID=1605838 RepID=A0ABR9C2B4_9PSED|nr:hypothetical protein [Pseudomonas coleopterorum]MBD8753746.1 hypothetical protein [Pseudomonas coleopterorum]MBD8770952.1 hypothetical protein [Pseudomonas coleopterorum]